MYSNGVRLLFYNNFDDQMSQNVHIFVILCMLGYTKWEHWSLKITKDLKLTRLKWWRPVLNNSTLTSRLLVWWRHLVDLCFCITPLIANSRVALKVLRSIIVNINQTMIPISYLGRMWKHSQCYFIHKELELHAVGFFKAVDSIETLLGIKE